jgi:type IV pilus modification protein PilV
MKLKQMSGLTLIEVLVAMMLLSVGVIAAAALQGTALRASSKATRIQAVTKIAEAELDYRRQVDLSETETANCETHNDGCTVVITPCDVVVTSSSASFDCSSNPEDVRAYRVSVSVDGPGDEDITLTTHVAQSQNRNALDFSVGNEPASESQQ